MKSLEQSGTLMMNSVQKNNQGRTKSEMLDQSKLDTYDSEHSNPTQLTFIEKSPSLKSKVCHQDLEIN